MDLFGISPVLDRAEDTLVSRKVFMYLAMSSAFGKLCATLAELPNRNIAGNFSCAQVGTCIGWCK